MRGCGPRTSSSVHLLQVSFAMTKLYLVYCTREKCPLQTYKLHEKVFLYVGFFVFFLGFSWVSLGFLGCSFFFLVVLSCSLFLLDFNDF